MRTGGKCKGRGVGEEGFHKPELLAFPVVPWGPKNTSHILLTPAALWHLPTNKRNAVRHLSLYRSPVSCNPARSEMKADATRNQMCEVRTAAAELSAAGSWRGGGGSGRWRWPVTFILGSPNDLHVQLWRCNSPSCCYISTPISERRISQS